MPYDLFNEKADQKWNRFRRNIKFYPDVLIKDLLGKKAYKLTVSELFEKLSEALEIHDEQKVAEANAARRAKETEGMTPKELAEYEAWEQIMQAMIEVAMTPLPEEDMIPNGGIIMPTEDIFFGPQDNIPTNQDDIYGPGDNLNYPYPSDD